MKNYKLLKQLSPVDDKDYHLSLFAARPRTFLEDYLITTCAKVKDQGETNTCVGHSLSTVKEAIEWVQRLKKLFNLPDDMDFATALEEIHKLLKENTIFPENIVFSPGFIYADRGPNDTQDEGMIPREALKRLKDNGAVLLDQFPYLGDYPTLKAKLQANMGLLLSEAEPYKITGFARLRTVEDIKTALMKLGPVTIGIPVYDSFFNVGADGIVPIPDYNKEALNGYHEITIVGWTKDYRWVVQNSWGESWGDKGFCYMPFNYPIPEAWSITDTIIPVDVTPLTPPPQPVVQPEAQTTKFAVIKEMLKSISDMIQKLIDML